MTEQTKQSVWERAQARKEENLAERLARAICERAGVEGGENAETVWHEVGINYVGSGKTVGLKKLGEKRWIDHDYGGGGGNYSGSGGHWGREIISTPCSADSGEVKMEYKFTPRGTNMKLAISRAPLTVDGETFVQNRVPISGLLYIAQYAPADLPGGQPAIRVLDLCNKMRTTADQLHDQLDQALGGSKKSKEAVLRYLNSGVSEDTFSCAQERYFVQLILHPSLKDKGWFEQVVREKTNELERTFCVKYSEGKLEVVSRSLGDRILMVPGFVHTQEIPRQDDEEDTIVGRIYKLNTIKIPLPGVPITPEVSKGLDYLADTLGKIRQAVEEGRK